MTMKRRVPGMMASRLAAVSALEKLPIAIIRLLRQAVCLLDGR
ncbi:hypothetical protein [Cohnella sp.]